MGPSASRAGPPLVRSPPTMRRSCPVHRRRQPPAWRSCTARPGALWSGVLTAIARIVLSSSVLAGIHVYLWLRLVRPARLSRYGRLAATLGLVALFLSVPITVA